MRKLVTTLLVLMIFSVPAMATPIDFQLVDGVGITGTWMQLHLLSTVTNNTGARETYIFDRQEFFPDGWSSSICVGDNCYAPAVSHVEFMLNDGESEDLWIYMNFYSSEVGTGTAILTGYSDLDPTPVINTYTGIHEDCDVLLVDDHDGSYVTSSIASNFDDLGVNAGFWPLADKAPSLVDLQALPMVFWLTGTSEPTLEEVDRTLLESYLLAGGGLMLSGQDIAYDLCDPASANYSAASKTWFEDVLGLEYISDGGSLDLNGQTGDFLGEQLSFTLGGNQTDPDVIDILTYDPVSVSFRYGSGAENGEIAGVTRGGDTRLIYLAFGLEGAAASGSDIIMRAMTILDTPTDVSEQVPTGLALLGNYPNPFNPQTTLSFTSTVAGLAEITVTDPQGRRINQVQVQVQSGINRIPFVAEDSMGEPMASGIYFYRVSLNGSVSEGKMTLIK
jgi:hypothetical protein